MENIWSENDGLLTDAENADNYVIELAIKDFQMSVKTITDMSAYLSAERERLLIMVSELQAAVTEVYAALLDKNIEKAKSILRKVGI